MNVEKLDIFEIYFFDIFNDHISFEVIHSDYDVKNCKKKWNVEVHFASKVRQ